MTPLPSNFFFPSVVFNRYLTFSISKGWTVTRCRIGGYIGVNICELTPEIIDGIYFQRCLVDMQNVCTAESMFTVLIEISHCHLPTENYAIICNLTQSN